VLLLEASAGTGKTFAIAALVARLVAEGTPLPELLVVTFTRMATGELRERVRDRLVTAEQGLARALDGVPPPTDDRLLALLAGGAEHEVRRRRQCLREALSSFDAATIATTHGFCQHALAGLGVLGDVERDVTFVDAPVLGTKQPAEAGELTVLASGPDEALDRCEPVFDAVGARTFRLGEAGRGTRMKMVLNSWLLSITAGLAETIALAERLGIDPERFLEVIKDGPMGVPYAELKGRMMIEEDFEPAFPLYLAAKDAGIVLEAGESDGAEMPLARAIRERYAEAERAGHGEEDMAAVYRVAAKEPSRR
jgi:hypothetical protein